MQRSSSSRKTFNLAEAGALQDAACAGVRYGVAFQTRNGK